MPVPHSRHSRQFGGPRLPLERRPLATLRIRRRRCVIRAAVGTSRAGAAALLRPGRRDAPRTGGPSPDCRTPPSSTSAAGRAGRRRATRIPRPGMRRRMRTDRRSGGPPRRARRPAGRPAGFRCRRAEPRAHRRPRPAAARRRRAPPTPRRRPAPSPGPRRSRGRSGRAPRAGRGRGGGRRRPPGRRGRPRRRGRARSPGPTVRGRRAHAGTPWAQGRPSRPGCCRSREQRARRPRRAAGRPRRAARTQHLPQASRSHGVRSGDGQDRPEPVTATLPVSGSAWRRVGVTVLVSLLAARARRAGLRRLAGAGALGLGTALAVVSAAITAVTAEGALVAAVADLPPGERSVAVATYGLPDPQRVAGLDALVRRRLPELGSGPVHRQLLYRELGDTHHNTVVLGAADDLPGVVRLVSGRLPASCTPTRCEVVLALPADAPAATRPPELDAALGVVVVGAVRRTDPLLLSGTFTPADGAPLLLGDGVEHVAAIGALNAFGRTIGWVAPLDLARIRAVGVDPWVDAATAMADDFARTTNDALTVTAPGAVLRAQHQRAVTNAQRFTLLGATGSILLLGAAVVGGAALRRDHEAFSGALRRRGAAPRLLAGLLAGEVAGAAVAGLVVGVVVGGVAAGAVAVRAGLAPLPTAGSAVLAALPASVGLTVAAALLLALTIAVPAARDGAAVRGVEHVVEAGALVCVAVAAVLVARGGVGVGSDAGTADPLLLTLPVLVLVAGALALARLWLPVVRGGQRLVPRGAVAARLGLSAVTGRPLRPAATAALLTAAVATSVFAGAYRATLDRGAADQAAYAVPLAARLQTGLDLERPYDVAPPAALREVLPGVTSPPVLRATASRRVETSQGTPVPLVGVDPGVLPAMAHWDDTVGGGDPADLATRLRVGAVPEGTPLPPGTELRIATPGATVTVAVTATVRADDGREQAIELRVARPGTAGAALVGDLTPLDRTGAARPAPATGRHLVALTLRLPTDEETRRVHNLGEGNLDRATPSGRFTLGTVTAGGTPAGRPWQGWSGGGLKASTGGDRADVRYSLVEGAAILTGRAGGPGDDGDPVPVAVDPATAAAARNGLLDLTLDQTSVQAKVVAVLPRFPTVTGPFAVLDIAALTRLVDLTTPGTAEPVELWLAAPDPTRLSTALAAAPFDRLVVQQRAPLEASLRADPIARGAAELLAWGAAVTLLAAAAALVLLVAAERHDDAAAEYAWEADGVAPGTLRAALWWRAAAVALPAVPAGILAGAALAALTARLVAVTATATAARPPLVAGAGVLPGSALALVVLLAALVAAAGLAALSLREPLPRRRTGTPA